MKTICFSTKLVRFIYIFKMYLFCLLSWFFGLILPIGLIIIILLNRFSSDGILDYLKLFYEHYGYQTIFIASLLESVIFVNFGFPGGTAVLLGASLAGSNRTLSIPIIIIVGTFAVEFGYIIDFLIGRFSSNLVKMKYLSVSTEHRLIAPLKITSKSHNYIQHVKLSLNKAQWPFILVISCIHPNLASYYSVYLGATSKPFIKFLAVSIISQLFWTSFWAVLASHFGNEILHAVNDYLLFLLILIPILFILTMIKSLKSSKEKQC
jgi:membrane protein DedA with SNARE-associated domain